MRTYFSFFITKVTPRSAKNVNGDDTWIVNVNRTESGVEYTQVVAVTMCLGNASLKMYF